MTDAQFSYSSGIFLATLFTAVVGIKLLLLQPQPFTGARQRKQWRRVGWGLIGWAYLIAVAGMFFVFSMSMK